MVFKPIGITIHYSASSNPSHDNLKTIRRWHKKRGFRMEGYHYFIRGNGTLEIGRSLDETGAHCKGFNDSTIGICLSGLDSFGDLQFDTLAKLIKNIMIGFNISKDMIKGHKERSIKKDCLCPPFSVDAFKKKYL